MAAAKVNQHVLKKLVAQANKCEQIEYELRDGSCHTVSLNDVLQMQNGDIGAALALYDNGFILLYDLGQKREICNVFCIKHNLSKVTDREVERNLRRHYWKEGAEVEVFSKSLKTWCKGEIMQIFELKSEDRLVAHTTRWYQLKYYNSAKDTYQFKQLPWNSDYLRAVVKEEPEVESEDRLMSSLSTTSLSFPENSFSV